MFAKLVWCMIPMLESWKLKNVQIFKLEYEETGEMPWKENPPVF